MLNIIIAFLKLEDAQNIKKVLVRNGYDINLVCTTGAQVVSIANELDEGFVLCGYRLADMHYIQLQSYLPKGFEMLLIASTPKLEECVSKNLVCLSLPFKTVDLLNTLEMMSYRRKRKQKNQPKQRSETEKKMILEAKQVLMERNNLSEEDAYRYLQKHSMDHGITMTETAEMVRRIMRRRETM